TATSLPSVSASTRASPPFTWSAVRSQTRTARPGHTGQEREDQEFSRCPGSRPMEAYRSPCSATHQENAMSTFITRLDTSGTGTRLAVKDLIDVHGTPTTAGSRAVEQTADAARRDAACLAGARAAGARIVGKTNLHELAMLPIGTNPWFGTPVNPLDADLIPGGSSSGSAVAVATGDADVAFGTDTGGSVRVPSACCGTAGLETTPGRSP